MANRFIGGVLSSQKASSGGFVSRASTGTYFDSTGVLRTAPINQPRLNYSYVSGTWTQPTVLIEPASTNIVSYSQDFSQASYWGPNNSTIASAATVAPDGTTTGFKIQENTSNSLHGLEQQLGNTNGLAYTLSIFAKAAERSWLIIDNTHQGVANYRNYFNLSTGTTGTIASGNSQLSIIPVGNGWYRCSVTRQAGTYGTHRICIYSSTGDATPTYTGTANSGIYVWGCQLEYQNGMTSYIISPSTGVGTRAQDDVGPVGSGLYTLSNLQNQTANDDQFTIQSFTTVGNSTWTAPLDVTSVEALVVGGGGGGGYSGGGGGGAGGVIYNASYPVIPGTTYPVIVGSGGAGSSTFARVNGVNGNNSQFGTIMALGGGGGSTYYLAGAVVPGSSGASGGGGSGDGGGSSPGGPGTAGQGYPGGASQLGSPFSAGGGGGANSRGADGGNSLGGTGGAGLFFSQFSAYGATGYFGGGGGGGAINAGASAGQGGAGGGAAGGTYNVTAGQPGVANTGGGGGGGPNNNLGTLSYGGAGGSGVVLIRYKRINTKVSTISNSSIVTQKFIASNTWIAPAGVTQVEALVVGGGGGGGYDRAGGGGAGGVSYSNNFVVTPGSAYNITIGSGGLGGTTYRNSTGPATAGTASTFGLNLITNGTFNTDVSGWTAMAGCSITWSNGKAIVTPSTTAWQGAYQTITTIVGKTYYARATIVGGSGYFGFTATEAGIGSAAKIGYASWNSLYNSDVVFSWTATATTAWIAIDNLNTNNTNPITVDNISVVQSDISLYGLGGGYGTDGAGGNAGPGGSGGGVGSGGSQVYTGGAGTSGQGFNGGTNGGGAQQGGAGGGGGAGGVGYNGGYANGSGGNGGPGVAYAITGNLEYYAGGGGGGAAQDFAAPKTGGSGGSGGGGHGGNFSVAPGGQGAPNTGGGGGGGSNSTQGNGGNGGTGVVVLRYRVPVIATFQDSGTWTCPAGITTVQALVVAGGGAGGGDDGGGGGAGGLVYSSSTSVIPGVTYQVIVGAGGIGGVNTATNGQHSSFAGLVAIGGGCGGGVNIYGSGASCQAQSGGSGGGAYYRNTASNAAGTPGSGTYGQGNGGGSSTYATPYPCGGGGGAGAVGGSATSTNAGAGGAGLAYSISGTSTYYAGGGGGSATLTNSVGLGGAGGGGNGGGTTAVPFPTAGTPNTGGGGGGAASGSPAAGGSGIVIIRWYGG